MWHDVETLNMNQYFSQSDEGQTLWSDMCRHVPGCLTVWKHDITWFPSQLPAADLLTVANTCAHVPTRMTPIIDWQKSAVRVRDAFSVTRAPRPPPPPPALPSLMAEVTWSGCRNGRNLLFEISSREVVPVGHMRWERWITYLKDILLNLCVCVWAWVTPPWLL